MSDDEKPDLRALTYRMTAMHSARDVERLALPYAVHVPAGWELHVRVEAKPIDQKRATFSIALATPCPQCGAEPREHCRGKRGPRASLHAARYEAR